MKEIIRTAEQAQQEREERVQRQTCPGCGAQGKCYNVEYRCFLRYVHEYYECGCGYMWRTGRYM